MSINLGVLGKVKGYVAAADAFGKTWICWVTKRVVARVILSKNAAGQHKSNGENAGGLPVEVYFGTVKSASVT